MLSKMKPGWIVVVLLLVGTALAGCLEETSTGTRAAGSEKGVAKPIVASPHSLVGPVNLSQIADPNATAFALRGLGVRASEPTLGVTSKGSVFFVAGTNIMRSRDLGLTWQRANLALPTPGAGTNVPPTTLDPMLYVDTVTDRVYADQLYVGCSFLSYSDDEGGLWVHNPAACGLPADDHQTISSGVSSLPAPLYRNRAFYYCSNQFFDATCSVSLDGGLTFPITRPLFFGPDLKACGGITGHVTTAPDGTVYVPAWRCDEPWIAVSRDSGQTWFGQRVSDDSSGEMDPSVAIDSAGNAYYFWHNKTGQPRFSVSTDKGRKWTSPINVSFPGYHSGSLPSIIAGDPGRVAFTYIATTTGNYSNPARVGKDVPWDLYVTVSLNALDPEPTFTTYLLNPLDDPVFRGNCGGGYRCGAIVDFMDITMDKEGRVYVASVDACGTPVCIGKPPAEGATTHGEGIMGVLLQGPSLKADKPAFRLEIPK
ncbi:MAG TPA: sialidase family protein [Candidatus Thermoplasmatota archaeon]|nr:sialidase family protein [Candidatus Thermoplasmatota archaeon]